MATEIIFSARGISALLESLHIENSKMVRDRREVSTERLQQTQDMDYQLYSHLRFGLLRLWRRK